MTTRAVTKYTMHINGVDNGIMTQAAGTVRRCGVDTNNRVSIWIEEYSHLPWECLRFFRIFGDYDLIPARYIYCDSVDYGYQALHIYEKMAIG